MAVPASSSSSITARAASLPEVVRWRSEHHSSETAFIFLADGEDDEHRLTYAELSRRAAAIAGALVNAGAVGSRALLVYDSGLDYIAALYGCFYAGVVAVPVYPPDPFRVDRTLPRLQAIVNDAGASWLLATAETLRWAKPLFANLPGLTSSLATDDLTADATAGRTQTGLPTPQPGQPALLQYTSGSTGVARGVTITHANLLANLRSIHTAVDRENNVAVLWLPAYHDMGLIGGIFQPVFSGRTSVLMSPVSFMQRPVRWLKAVTRHRGTVTAAPNFAYDLCVRKLTADDRKELDLSSLLTALNGAEIIRPETLERFSETFAECGFRREAFLPCYGLAEATLMVAGCKVEAPPVVRSFSAAALACNRAEPVEAGRPVCSVGVPPATERAGETPTPHERAVCSVGVPPATEKTGETPALETVETSAASTLVGCGQAVPGQRIVIVDPESLQPLAPGQVGEIWVAGESIGQGYWNHPEESEVTFRAYLPNGEGPFLRTGDLGFFDGGELFIAGRRKELIIIQGRNHYPHDIEETVWRSHPLLKADGGAAFSIEVDGEERLAVVQEVIRPKKADLGELMELIRSQVAEVHGVPPVAVVLIPAGTLPKTSSGKKQRRGCREQFLSGDLPSLSEWRDERLFANGTQQNTPTAAPQTETELKLAAIWSDVLGVETRDVHANFFDLGGQSLLAGQLAAGVQETFAVEMPLRKLFANPTIAMLAAWLDSPEDHRRADALPPVTRADRSQPLPLSSSQEQLWFLEQLEPEPRYNLAASIRLHGPLNVPALEQSLATILARHEALRTRFPSFDGLPRQIIDDTSAADSLAGRPSRPSDETDGLEGRPTGPKLNLATGPLLTTALHRIAENDHRLSITAHHLICDGWSLAILLRELADLYGDAARHPSPVLQHVANDETTAVAGAEAGRSKFGNDEMVLPASDAPVGTSPILQPVPNDEKTAVAGAEAGRSELSNDEMALPASDAPVVASPGHRRGKVLYANNSFGAALPQPPLREIDWHYADFAVWQRNCLASPQLARQLEYWQRQLAGVEPLNLITDYHRTADATFRGASVDWVIGKPVAETLTHLGQREGATLYMVLLAAFQTLLGRYSRQHDVCVGSPVSYRPRREFERSIGYFVNTLVLRTDLSGEPTFRQLLARVRETVLDALTNGDAPLRAVVDAVAPRREAGRTPLFNVMFVFENLAWQTREAAGVTFGDIEIDHTRIGSYDLGLVIEEQPERLKASLVYNAELFDSETVESMRAAFRMLLDGLVADADASVMRLPLVKETRPVVNDPRLHVLQNRAPVDDEQAWGGLPGRLFPDGLAGRSELANALAVTDGRRQLTYRELDEQANRLAHYLQSCGVGPEVSVAIYLDRSIELVVAMLAVLRAGGAYVPFDTNEAAERLESMLADTEPRAILTTSRLAARLPKHSADVIALDRQATDFSRHPATPPAPTSSDALAYIIYTSGSSGKPKGVEVSRAALNNLVQAMADTYELSAGDRVLQIISPAFDVAAEEIYPTLLRGATLVLGPPTTELTGRAILDVCLRERVSVAHVPPQLWQQCLLEWQPTDELLFDHLRVLVHGGEALSAEAVTRWLRMARGRVKTLLEFGLTETTVTNLVYQLPVELDSWPVRRKLPIGCPVARSEALVLDEYQQRLPQGAPGELYLGGPGVARGYHRLPEATEERFVTLRQEGDGVTATSQTMRFCRTGDLARLRADGNLEFLGRIDTQIKLRGLRIEPGEIERALAAHPTVSEAAVILREDVPGLRRLVAYLVPANGQVADGNELRAWLHNKLSDSMVPAAFVTLDRLPLNRSHKLDREALPPPPAESETRSYTAPRSEAEKLLADVWQAVLKLDRVGIHDNFFELGGDSILTIQVVARAREAGLRFTPRQLFEHQTIADLATVEGADTSAAEQGQVMGDVPLTPIQHWFLRDEVVDPHHFNQAVLLRLSPTLDPDHLPDVFARLIEQHDALRLRFTRGRDGWRQFHAADATWHCERIDLSELGACKRPGALTAAANRLQAALDLEQGPTARAAWFNLGAGQTRLLLVVHHLVVDAVSWRVLLEDLTRVWQQLESGQAPTLPPKTSSFKQWAERLADYASSYELESELPFWQTLAGQRVLPLPQDADGENRYGDTAVVSGEWSPVETGELLNEANAAYRTQTNELLLAALGQTLSRWAGGELPIDVEGHGRAELFDDLDLSRTVGWFTAWRPHLAPRVDLPPGALLRQTKEALRAAPHQGLGFGLLRYLSPETEIRERMAALPRAEVSFNYLGRIDDYLSSPFLTPAEETIGPTRSPRAVRSHQLEINAYVLDGRLRVDWTFCRNLHRRETIERLAAAFRDCLATLVGHCLSPEAGGFTPSDFPLARLNAGELDQLSKLLGND